MNAYHAAIVLAIVGFVTDAVTTYVGLGSMGLSEQNAVARQAIASYGLVGGIVALSAAGFALILAVAYAARTLDVAGSARGATYGVAAVGIMKLVVSAHNLRLILGV